MGRFFEVQYTTANSCGRCNRAGRSRRSERIRCCSGANGFVGETPNLAARLQGIAEPNTVVIAESTRKLIGDLVDLEDPRVLGPQGHCQTGANMGGAAGKFSGKPV